MKECGDAQTTCEAKRIDRNNRESDGDTRNHVANRAAFNLKMKFKRKIRQPKKAKKVTLARIREIFKEELSALSQPSIGFTQIPPMQDLREDLPKLLSDKPHDGGKNYHSPFMYAREETPMYFPPAPIKPVPPPPGVRRLDNPPPVALPNCFEVEYPETVNEKIKEPI